MAKFMRKGSGYSKILQIISNVKACGGKFIDEICEKLLQDTPER